MKCKNWILQNFPFIENDVDALTDYKLFSMGFGYLDKKKANKNDIPDVSEFITKNVKDLTYYTQTNGFSPVAFSGNYNDLSNKPTIPDVSNFITKDVDDLTYYTKTSELSSVATSGDYDDLLNKPTIPDVSNFITKDVDDLTYYTKSSNLANVATSGNYNDLSNKPTIPSLISYSTSEQDTGIKWIDNKEIYCKTVDLGYLTSGDSSIAHNISNINMIIKVESFFYNENNKTYFPIPRSYPTNADLYTVAIDVGTTNITLTCGTNYNGTIFKGYATIYYTKTS